MLTFVKWALNWLYANATAKVYTSAFPIGRPLGGKDIPQLPDGYIILDIRAAGKILVLGYFQTT